MIEIIARPDERVRDLSGKYVLGGLPVGRNLFFPASPVLVERSMGQSHGCRKLVVSRDHQGYAHDVDVYAGEGPELYRVRQENVRFVCDTAEEALALLNTQGAIRDAVSRRNFENDREIDGEIRKILEDVCERPAPARRM